MELRYPIVIFIGIVIIIFIFKFFSRKVNYSDGNKAANTKYIKNLAYYQDIMKKYKLLSFLIQGICVLSIIISLILLARPSKVQKYDNESYSRDIFICMDISSSVDELNLKLVDSLKKIIKKLNQERVGITVFNTSSALLSPLTDDYEYLGEVLDNIEKGINISNQWNNFDFSNYSFSGMNDIDYVLDRYRYWL